MKNPENDHNEGFMPEEKRSSAQHVNPEIRDTSGNWDEEAHMSRNLEKNIQHNERRHLNPDREKRNNSNLSSDRNGGDR